MHYDIHCSGVTGLSTQVILKIYNIQTSNVLIQVQLLDTFVVAFTQQLEKSKQVVSKCSIIQYMAICV